MALSPIKQKGGKLVHAWAFEGDCDPATITSNTFMIEWPPRSGQQSEFPEVDRAECFDLSTAVATGLEGSAVAGLFTTMKIKIACDLDQIPES